MLDIPWHGIANSHMNSHCIRVYPWLLFYIGDRVLYLFTLDSIFNSTQLRRRKLILYETSGSNLYRHQAAIIHTINNRLTNLRV